MAYTKPTVVAQNSKAGSFAAGCPVNGPGGYGGRTCQTCERSK